MRHALVRNGMLVELREVLRGRREVLVPNDFPAGMCGGHSSGQVVWCGSYGWGVSCVFH